MVTLPQVLLLLGLAVAVVGTFQFLRIPSPLAYLLVGVILGPYTVGPVIDRAQLVTMADFGIVFLLFTIGLGYSVAEFRTIRGRVLWLGTAQVVLTTALVAAMAWAAGLPASAAFVTGAVFAQSSSSVIGKLLEEQGEEHSGAGRLGLAMSVFQDVTAVPFVIVIPVLGAAAAGRALAGELGWAMAKAVAAVALVLVAGRRLLRPALHVVARRRSAELFTLSVLLVVLVAAWITGVLGLSLAFGAFLAGMVVGGTEFRHQVKASIRPFRDVLLGVFFVAIGMLVDPGALWRLWPAVLLGTFVLLTVKALLVMALVRLSALGTETAVRTGLLLSVGGEFGFALLAIAFETRVVQGDLGQILLLSVILAMVLGALLIRYNAPIARAVGGWARCAREEAGVPRPPSGPVAGPVDHVIIAGYGRVGQGIARFLQEEDIPYVALDLDAALVREAHDAAEPIYYGDAGERGVLESAGIDRARLLVVSHEDVPSALRTLAHARAARPDLPVMVRARDEGPVEVLMNAGAREVVPETLEASLTMASQVLLLLGVSPERVMDHMQRQRAERYPLMREAYGGDEASG
jgi:Kef-type K+ transport systems, membrane components